MGEEKVLVGELFFVNSDGATEKLCDIKNISEFDSEPNEDVVIKRFDFTKPIEFTIRPSRRSIRRLNNLIMWNWRAKGHLRREALHRAALLYLKGMRKCL